MPADKSSNMKAFLVLGLVGILATTLSAADSASQTKIRSAAKKVADQGNYSWTTSTREADGSPGKLSNIEGKAEPGGGTFLSFAVGGLPVEVYMKGDKGTAKALEGWQTFDEIAATGGTPAAVVRFLRAYQTPASESTALAGKMSEFKEVDGVLEGALKEEAVTEFLLIGTRRREGQEPPKTSDTKGSVKFWIKDGALTKYEIKVQGKVAAGDRQNDINRTTTVEIKEVGTTKLEVPAEAKQKMS